MSALDRITDKHTKNMTKLEFAIFMLWNSFSEDGIAGKAAEELAEKDATIAALRERVEEAELRNKRALEWLEYYPSQDEQEEQAETNRHRAILILSGAMKVNPR